MDVFQIRYPEKYVDIYRGWLSYFGRFTRPGAHACCPVFFPGLEPSKPCARSVTIVPLPVSNVETAMIQNGPDRCHVNYSALYSDGVLYNL